jgi:hypothetical protein
MGTDCYDSPEDLEMAAFGRKSVLAWLLVEAVVLFSLCLMLVHVRTYVYTPCSHHVTSNQLIHPEFYFAATDSSFPILHFFDWIESTGCSASLFSLKFNFQPNRKCRFFKGKYENKS